MNESYAREIEVARHAARLASERIVELSGPDKGVRWKGVNDPVTAADEAATGIILEVLAREFPGEPVLIEERADDRSRLGADRVWIVDPLDGTREFVDGIPEYSVMIGLVEGGRPVAGLVHVPLTGVSFAGVPGAGASMIDPGGKRTALVCSPAPRVESMRLVVSRSHRSPAITRAMEILGISAEVPSGSVGLKVARIATGQADLYIHLGPGIKLWDACAPEAVLRAAGGTMTDPSGVAIDYMAESVQCASGLLATCGSHHDEISLRLRPLLSVS